MADEEQLHRLRQGTAVWNAWRKEAPDSRVDLREADLRRADLREFDLRAADLDKANLTRADLSRADLSSANLTRADLSRADLSSANLTRAGLARADLAGTNLAGANLARSNLAGTNLAGTNFAAADLREANLRGADLRGVNLGEADLHEVRFSETVLSDVDLSRCKNLESVVHRGPSPIDIRTLQRSGRLPLIFLRGVGLPDTLIECLPALLGQAIQHYSCFISYSSKDEVFAKRLHADLQDKGVRCWFAPHDMKIGAKILDTLDEAIRLRDKVLLVLSEGSLASEWVEDEVEKAFEEERQRGGVVLFPVRVDDAVSTTQEAWAAKLRRSRHIGDFRAWKDHDAYQTALDRVLRDLRRVETPDAASG
jgi:hypothetical protein